MGSMRDLFGNAPAIIGMVHLKPLPGAPRASESMAAIFEAARADAVALEKGGVSAILLENFGDAPFYPDAVPPETVSAMAAIAQQVKNRINVPLGINVLRNDGEAALAIAHAVGAQFIRVNVLAGSAVTDQGVISSQANSILRLRKNLQAEVKILADVHVKHATPLGAQPIEQAASELFERALADAVIVTGSATGARIDLDTLQRVRRALPDRYLIAGSGVTAENAAQILQLADAAIVGTYFKADGKVGQPVQPDRVTTLTSKLKR